MPRAVIRFCKYSSIGVSAFLLDLLLFYILINFFSVNYLVATGIAFLLAISINYHFSKRFVFKGTKQKKIRGYSNFLLIAGIGLLFLELLMILFVEVLGLDQITSRVIAGGIVGVWNYLMNLFVNFKVAGKHYTKSLASRSSS